MGFVNAMHAVCGEILRAGFCPPPTSRGACVKSLCRVPVNSHKKEPKTKNAVLDTSEGADL